jgi:hypothetical protein
MQRKTRITPKSISASKEVPNRKNNGLEDLKVRVSSQKYIFVLFDKKNRNTESTAADTKTTKIKLFLAA